MKEDPLCLSVSLFGLFLVPLYSVIKQKQRINNATFLNMYMHKYTTVEKFGVSNTVNTSIQQGCIKFIKPQIYAVP